MFNKVVLLGNLTRNIELRYISNGGSAVASSGIAVNRKFSVNGEKREEVCFIDITFFGRTAEVANQYLSKGSKVLIEGRLKLDQWTDTNGQNRSRHTVIVESLEMIGGQQSQNSYQDQNYGYQKQNQQNTARQTPNQTNQNQKPANNSYNEKIASSQFDNDEIPF